MNTGQSIRASATLMALALIAGPNTPAFAAVSDPAKGQAVLIGTDVVAPVPGVRVEADTTPKMPLIRLAPYQGCEVGPVSWRTTAEREKLNRLGG